MRRLLISAAGLALFSSAALAADLPAYEAAPVVAVQSFLWTGVYVGAQAGYAWSKSPSRFTAPVDRPKGWLLGGFAGYNVQLDNSPVVFGIETDFNWSDVDDKGSILGVFGVKQETKWEGATRGRIGYAFERFLVYGAGGVAYAKRELSTTGPAATFSDHETAVGWTVGGGVEAAVTDNIIARVEYRYTDYGKDKFTLGGPTSPGLKLTQHRVMGGVAYKFGW